MATVTKTVLDRDPITLDPKHYKVELENDDVRVVRIKYGGLEGSVMHQHRPGLGTFLTDAKFKFTYPDGRTETLEGKAGECIWFGELWEHNAENLVNDVCEVLYVELKH